MTEPPYLVEPDDVETLSTDWGALKRMSAPEVIGDDRSSAGVVTLEPGESHERHTHPDSDEILYVVRGTGEQEIAEESRETATDDVVYDPEGVEHGTVNTGWEPLTLLAVHAPPGPESELREDPDCTVVPAGEVHAEREPADATE